MAPGSLPTPVFLYQQQPVPNSAVAVQRQSAIYPHNIIPLEPLHAIVQQQHQLNPQLYGHTTALTPAAPPLTKTEITETVRTVRRRPRTKETETVIEQRKPVQVVIEEKECS